MRARGVVRNLSFAVLALLFWQHSGSSQQQGNCPPYTQFTSQVDTTQPDGSVVTSTITDNGMSNSAMVNFQMLPGPNQNPLPTDDEAEQVDNAAAAAMAISGNNMDHTVSTPSLTAPPGNIYSSFVKSFDQCHCRNSNRDGSYWMCWCRGLYGTSAHSQRT